jgi:ABC-2 type transport system permease protein
MAGIAGSRAPTTPADVTGEPPRAVSFAIRPSHVRALLWLRWKITLRGYARSWQRVVGLIFALLFIIPAAGGLASLTAFGYLTTPYAFATQILFVVVALLYLIWAALPLLQYTLNEGLDVTKLVIYPVTRGEQMVSLVIATLLDISTLFILAFYIAIVVGFHATPLAAVVTLVALVAIYIHTIGLSQLMLAALMGLLRSRRYRDLTVVVFALFGSVCSFSQVFFSRFFTSLARGSRTLDTESLHVERILHWTPPGMAAQAIVDANAGDYLHALPWLLASLALIPALLAAWAFVLDRGITNAETGGAGRSRRRHLAPPAAAVGSAAVSALPLREGGQGVRPAARGWRPISRPALAFTQKEARYLWRDPQLKAALISVLFATVFILVPNIFGGGRNGNGEFVTFLSGPRSVLVAPIPALLAVLTFALNALGMERQGLQTLFLFPVRPLDVFYGKNLFVGAFAMALGAVLTVIKAWLTGGWEYIPVALAAALAAVLVMLGCGNITSVLSPFRWRQMRMGETSTLATENGCLRSIVSMVALFVTAILVIPTIAAVALPLFLNHPEYMLITLPASIVYAAFFYQVATRSIAPVMLRRAPEILAVTVREA